MASAQRRREAPGFLLRSFVRISRIPMTPFLTFGEIPKTLSRLPAATESSLLQPV